MRIGLVTKEWPPHIYGGAGVHALQLTQALQESISVDVHCFGQERTDATGYPLPEEFSAINPALQAFVTDIQISQSLAGVDLVHSHTWYANLAGHFAAMLHGIPHVITAHSLEPDRPWKAEQLGGGYRLSSWAEKTAYEAADAIIAVSDGMKGDILRAYPALNPKKIHTILNGVDTQKYSPKPDTDLLESLGISGRYAIFVGRITRQKGLAHLLRAWEKVSPDFGLVIAAGSPDEPAIGAEISDLIHRLQSTRKNIWWQEKMLPQGQLNALLSSADLFICPSVYEPLGIVNLEAMACQTAVLASRVGGIPEVVDHKITGELVEYNGEGPAFENSLTLAIEKLMNNPSLLKQYGDAGRQRAIDHFGWPAIATQTIELYQSVIREYGSK
ncbi:MAG: glycogen synthase [Actinomycetes bacterium]|jgi:alpha-maltose-1-phosphate synthase